MKKFIRSTTALLLVLLMLFATSILSVSAAEDALDVDGRVSYAVGDTMTYTLCMSDTTEYLVGLQMYVKYDPQYLELNSDTVEYPNLNGTVMFNDTTGSNPDEGFIFTYTNAQSKNDFSTKKTFIKMDFKVLKAGATDVTYIIEEMYGIDMTYLKQYTLSVDYSNNGTVIKSDVPPVVNKDPDFVADHNGQFINFEDGKGQENPDVKEEERQIVTADPNYIPQNNNNNQAQVVTETPVATDINGNIAPTSPAGGSTLASDEAGNYVDDQGNTLSTDADGNYVYSDGKVYQFAIPYEKSFVDILLENWIWLAVAVVAVAGIVVAVILMVKNNKKNDKSVDTKKDSESTDITADDFDFDLEIDNTDSEQDK